MLAREFWASFYGAEGGAESSLGIDQDQRGRPLHPVGVHGQWDRRPVRIGGIDTDRKADPVLREEHFERFRRHDVVVFEDGVQTDHRHAAPVEGLMNTLRQRNRARDAARAEHLERHQDDDATPEVVEGKRLCRVEPSRGVEFRCPVGGVARGRHCHPSLAVPSATIIRCWTPFRRGDPCGRPSWQNDAVRVPARATTTRPPGAASPLRNRDSSTPRRSETEPGSWCSTDHGL